jgi:hypothetical protein
VKKTFLAAVFAATIAVSGLGSTSAYASVFSDINTVPWPEAAQYIDEAYNLGLMAGYVENGQRYCKPNNNVTYCEAVQLMYAIMSSYTGTSVSSSVVTKWTSTMVSANIPSWAYNAVAYALENSILSTKDISIFMASSSTQNNARREDIAVIFGKALSKVYGLSSSPTLTYADKSQIASTSVPYVELLNRLNIMVGDANNKFNPKVNINKAEMSVIVTKTYNALKSGGGSTTNPGTVVQYAGKITEITSSGSGYSVSVSVNGSTKKFTANATTSVTGADGKSSSVAKLSTGDSVVAVCKGDVASTIIVMSEGEESTTSKSGTINNITEDEIVLKTSSGNKTYDIEDSDITVTIDGSSSSLSSLVNKFKGGTNYSAKVYINDDDEVTKIEATKGSSTGDYDKDAIKTFTSSYVKTYNDDKYEFPDEPEDVDFTLDGDDIDYDDLKDKFEELDDDEQMIIDDYELDRDDEYLESLDVVIEDLETSSSSESDKSGLVTDISTSEVEINDDKSYDFADEDDIDSLKLDGEKYDTDEDGLEEFVKDIEDEDDVYIELTLNSKNKITKAVAYTCSTEDVTIDDIDDMEDDEISGYEYSSSTSVNIVDGDSSITSTSKLEKAVEDDGKEIEAVLVINDDDEIVAITGYVSAINDAKVDTFKVKDDPEDCYLILDISTSSVKYYFDDEWSIKDIESLEDDFKDDYDKATITLTDEGKIEDEGLDLR